MAWLWLSCPHLSPEWLNEMVCTSPHISASTDLSVICYSIKLVNFCICTILKQAGPGRNKIC